MALYKVSYHGKNYDLEAGNAVAAIMGLAQKRVFGSPLIPCRVDLIQMDADTCGGEWAYAVARWSDWTACGPGPSKPDREIRAQRVEVKRYDR